MPGQLKKSEDFGGESEPYPNSLWGWLSDEGSNNRTRPAFYAYNGQTREVTKSLEYGKLLDRVEMLAGAWTSSGIVARDTILVILDNSAAEYWTVLFWLAVRLGLTFAPLDTSIFRRPEELQSMVQLLEPRAIVVQHMDCAREWDKMAFEQTPVLQLVCETPTEQSPAWTILDTLGAAEESAPYPEIHLDDVFMIVNTSGSTNLPKCCPITVRMLISEIRQYHSMHLSRFSPSAKHLISISISRPIAYLACVNTWRGGGATIFVGGGFDAKTTSTAIQDLACTHAWFVPAMINILHAAKDQASLESLQTVFMSGDTAGKEAIEKARSLLAPDCHMIPHWGMSEGAPLFGYTQSEEISFEKSSAIAGIGRALRGTRVRICKSGSVSVVPQGEQGELHVNSDSMIDHYLGNRSEEDFYDDDAGRWFKTGDTAVMDASGIIYIVGRTKDIIVYRGRNIVPAVIQRHLQAKFPAEWVVVGLKHELNGEVPAVVTKELPTTKDAVLEYAKHANIDDSHLAGGIYTLEELGFNDWPYNATNKIQKRDLVAAIEKFRPQNCK